MKKILVTCALPYANGSIHLGHMFEHIQADIWVRYKKMKGNQVYFICADDAHGTPIMIKAKSLGIKPEEIISKMYEEHKKDFIGFNINYDNYHSTHSKENKKLSLKIYNILNKKGLIRSKFICQFYDVKKKMFLPDRFVKGKCPTCYALDQYGDNCTNCGEIYNSIELINPKSVLSNTKPIIKKSEHFFFNLPYFKKMLFNWINSGVLQNQVKNKSKEWFNSKLNEWDISRDSPYFGFKIPNSSNKYFYVWLDATIGYMSSFKNLCKKRNDISFKEFWSVDSKVDLYHFIGKDIIYFHSLFWPAILEGSNFRKPTGLFVHGYVTINGKKISKSKGTLIKASTYLANLDPDCLRYYYATKLSSNIDDIDLNFTDFVQKVNSDIVNKVVNLASRSSKFINESFNNYLSSKIENKSLHEKFINAEIIISDMFEKREINNAVRKIIYLADLANQYIEKKKPWIIAKSKEKKFILQSVCSMGINLFRILMIYLKPILPNLTKKTEFFLNDKLTWSGIYSPLLSHKINKFNILFNRINMKQVESIINK